LSATAQSLRVGMLILIPLIYTAPYRIDDKNDDSGAASSARARCACEDVK
jgi:hypothetical protein